MIMQPFVIETIKRELKQYARHRGAWLQPLLFFMMVAGIFSIVLGDVPERLRLNAPGILWVGVVLSLILSQESVFYSDNESGSLEALLLSPVAQSVVLAIKVLVHALAVGLPLLCLTVLVAWIFDVSIQGIKGLALSMSLCIPALSFVAAIATALTVQLKQGGVLLAILVLPLMAPIILFGSNATQAAIEQLPMLPHLAILLALLLLLLVLAPITCLFALRISAEN